MKISDPNGKKACWDECPERAGTMVGRLVDGEVDGAIGTYEAQGS